MLTETILSTKHQARQRIRTHIEAWLAAGNQIRVIPPGLCKATATSYALPQSKSYCRKLVAAKKAKKGKPA